VADVEPEPDREPSLVESPLMTHVKHAVLVVGCAYVAFVGTGVLGFALGPFAFGLVPLVGVLLLFRGPRPPWIGIGVLVGTMGLWILFLSGG
jgi:hypothetical protein